MGIQNQVNSVCIRCGKTRVLLKTWSDRGENKRGALVTHEQTVCPDKECQKIVDEKFQKMRDLRMATENRRKNIVFAKTSASQSNK